MENKPVGGCMKRLATSGRLLLCLTFLMLSTSTCSTVREYVSANPRTAIGAGGGAASGALIGGLGFDNTGAAVAGGLLGGLAGGLVGRALERRNEDYDKTARNYGYLSATRETILRIEDVDTDPERINAREKVNLVARYAVLPPDKDQHVSVTEQWRIVHDGRLVGDPVLTLRRPGGTWSSAIPITLPANAAPGTYRASVEIVTAGASDRGSTTFAVK
jgi:hypothetical protein